MKMEKSELKTYCLHCFNEPSSPKLLGVFKYISGVVLQYACCALHHRSKNH